MSPLNFGSVRGSRAFANKEARKGHKALLEQRKTRVAAKREPTKSNRRERPPRIIPRLPGAEVPSPRIELAKFEEAS